MVDPRTSSFHVSWQDWDDETQTAEFIEDGGEVVGADVAFSWGRARSDAVLVRRGHTDDTHNSAGEQRLTSEADGAGREYPPWPPAAPPAEGWWTPADEEASARGEMERAMNDPDPTESSRMGVVEPEIRAASTNGDG
jgi:hypothetical protein